MSSRAEPCGCTRKAMPMKPFIGRKLYSTHIYHHHFVIDHIYHLTLFIRMKDSYYITNLEFHTAKVTRDFEGTTKPQKARSFAEARKNIIRWKMQNKKYYSAPLRETNIKPRVCSFYIHIKNKSSARKPSSQKRPSSFLR